MPRYRYRAITAQGLPVADEIDAPSRSAVIDRIQQAGHVPIRADEIAHSGLRAGNICRHLQQQRITAREVQFFTRELATLLQTGLSLEQSLQMFQSMSLRQASRRLVEDLHARVRTGASLSQALAEQDAGFSRLYLGLVRAGEASGSLEVVLTKLADYLDDQAQTRSTVISATIYPAMLLSIAFMSVITLLVLVVPRFEVMFTDMGAALPLSTQLVFYMTGMLQHYGIPALLLLASCAWLYRYRLQQPANRLRHDARLLRIPILAGILIKLETGCYCHTLATLLGCGIPMLKAAQLAREVLTNQALAQQAARVESALKQGRGLGQPLRENPYFPDLAGRMISLGEEAGQLECMLFRVAELHARDCHIAVKRMLTIFEPVLIFGIGVVVATIILSLFTAILGMNALVG